MWPLLGNDTHATSTTSTMAAASTTRRYTPFGTLRGTSAAWPDDHGFLGQPTDSTGLDYFNNRYYDPATGQFMSVDPLVASTRTPYLYGNGNPVTFSDPGGLSGTGWSGSVSANTCLSCTGETTKSSGVWTSTPYDRVPFKTRSNSLKQVESSLPVITGLRIIGGGKSSDWLWTGDSAVPVVFDPVDSPVETALAQLAESKGATDHSYQSMLTPQRVDIVQIRHFDRNEASIGIEFSVVSPGPADTPDSVAQQVMHGANGQPNVIVIVGRIPALGATAIARGLSPDGQAVMVFDSNRGFVQNDTGGLIFGTGPYGPDGHTDDDPASLFGTNSTGTASNGDFNCCVVAGA